MTAPTAPQASAAQLAALAALIQAQADVRAQLTRAAVAAAVAAFDGIDGAGWWNPATVDKAITSAARMVAATQKQAARMTDAYLARAATVMTGRTVAPVGAVDITKLRRAIPDQVAQDLIDGHLEPAYVLLGEHDPANRRVNPAASINDPAVTVVPDPGMSVAERIRRQRAAQALAATVAPEMPYGRVADGYRYDIVEREHLPEIAKANALVRVEAVAATDITLAVREQYRATLTKLRGVTGWRRILRPELSQTGPCGLCVVAADRTYHVQDLKPIHNRCVPAGTRVAAEGVLAMTRRHYSGALIILCTASGQELAITANHPVLTDQGWIPAHLVDKGHHLVHHNVGPGTVGRSPYKGDGPPLVEDVWRAATVNRPFDLRTVPLAPEDFHGDWSKGEVDVVSTDGGLPRVGDVSFGQPARELLFVGGSGFGVALPPAGLLGQKVLRHGFAPHGRVCRCGDRLPLRSGGTRVKQLDRLGLTAQMDTRFFQPGSDDPAFEAVLLGQRQLGNAGTVLGDDLFHRQDLTETTRFDPAFAQFSGEGRHTYASLGRNLWNRLAGHVKLDRVVDYRRVEGTHVVFNLHTAEGWYSANNYIVSNCVCEVLPVIGDNDPGLLLNRSDLAAIYEAAGGTGGEVIKGGKRHSGALKRIRVALAEHGELGPVLVDADQHHRGPREVAAVRIADKAARLRILLEGWERDYARLIRRREDGEDVAHPLDWQGKRLAKLRRELEAL